MSGDNRRPTSGMTVTVCIATIARPQALTGALESWRNGTILPTEVRVVDASRDEETRKVCEQPWQPLVVRYIHSDVASAAAQRNRAAEGCTTDLIVFCDDDVEIPRHALETFLGIFADDTERRIGGVAGTIAGLHHRIPGRWLRWYYRIQAGYAHEHYGGHFFGPAINILPTDEPGDPVLYPSKWLNAGLVAYRTSLLGVHRFPAFDGYSFQEDVNLSARIGRTHQLYFHRGIRYVHKALPGAHKSDARILARMRLEHRWRNATDLLGLTGLRRAWAFLLSVLLESVYLFRRRPPGWRQELATTWRSFSSLVLTAGRPRS